VSRDESDIRVVIVAENASAAFGGEAILPLHYFRVLRRRGVEAWLVVHARTRDELTALMPDDADRIDFLPDRWYHQLAYRVGRRLPARLNAITFEYAMRVSTQLAARRLVRRLVRRHRADVVHQPTPVSPREPSLMYGVGAPVVIGPMNGGMSYPPAFARLDGRATALAVAVGRRTAAALNRLFPGKLRASALLVANARTRAALPPGARGEVLTLVENGVDLALWEPAEGPRAPGGPTRFVFVGRLVDWKCVDLLLEAFRDVVARVPAELEVLGDGPMRTGLEARAAELGISGAIRFSGWVPQAECARRLRGADALVLPSVYECGGAVVLEALACGLPVVATDWGGPADYLDPSCGVLVAPDTRPGFVAGLADAMIRLARSPVLREAMGRAGRAKVLREYDWERKVDRMLEIYHRAAGREEAGAGEPASALAGQAGEASP
jgi:glycosyltransferase involved in cell wall biosynthesis